jgi:ribosome-associated protein
MNGIPESELRFDFSRSSGPGGQNVNKVSSKAQVRWHVGSSLAFSDEQKALIRAFAGKHLTKDDEIVLAAESERSQLQNKEEAVRRLQALVAAALAPRKKRRPTKVSRAQKRKRVEEKRIVGEKKRARRPVRGEW